MKKNWLGYVSVLLFLLAGIFQIVATNYWLGALFIVVAVANFIVFSKLKKINNNSGK